MDRKYQIFTFLEFLKFLIVEIVILIPGLLISAIKYLIPKSRKNISGQLAMITGGSEGIGRALAFRLAKEGCRIAIVNRNLKKGQKTAEEIHRKFKVDVKAFQCDVSKREDVRRLKGEVKNSLGTVDLLINNAGLLSLENSVLEGDDETYQYTMNVNLTSFIWVSKIGFIQGIFYTFRSLYSRQLEHSFQI